MTIYGVTYMNYIYTTSTTPWYIVSFADQGLQSMSTIGIFIHVCVTLRLMIYSYKNWQDIFSERVWSRVRAIYYKLCVLFGLMYLTWYTFEEMLKWIDAKRENTYFCLNIWQIINRGIFHLWSNKFTWNRSNYIYQS